MALVAEVPPAGRKERETLMMPKDLPSANDLHHWLALTAPALVEASAYDDRAEVAWLCKVNDPGMKLHSFADSGKDRFKNLDMMLPSFL